MTEIVLEDCLFADTRYSNIRILLDGFYLGFEAIDELRDTEILAAVAILNKSMERMAETLHRGCFLHTSVEFKNEMIEQMAIAKETIFRKKREEYG